MTIAQGRVYNRKFPAHTEQLADMRNWAREVALANGLSRERSNAVIIGVNEACMNIIEHAYHNKPGEIVMDVFTEDGKLVFLLTDFAPTIDHRNIQPRDLGEVRPGGLGVHFIREVMDEVEYLPGKDGVGNVIKMKVQLA